MYTKQLIMIFIFTLLTPLSIWSQNHSIAIFQYYSPDSESSQQYGFLNFTISDIIHQELLNENLFFVIEKNIIENEVTVNSWDINDLVEFDNKLTICRSLNCDYFIWGYYIVEQGNLIIFNNLVETSTGRTLKILKKEFPTGPQIFNEVEEFTKSFTFWVNQELPEREIHKEVIIIQETVYVEEDKLMLVEIGVGVFCNIIISPYFSNALGNGIGGVLDINLYPYKTGVFYFGLSIPITMLQTKNVDLMNIDVLLASALLRAGFDWEPHSSFHIQLSAKFGASFLFGYKDNEILSYVRPSLGTEFNLALYPLYLSKKDHQNPDLISIQLGVSYLFVYDTYQGESNHLFQPQVEFSFSF